MSQAVTTQRVLGELRSRILLRELLPGEQLRQEQLAEDLSTSRVPLREALLILANEGLLTHHPNRGFVVTKRSPEELAQVHLLLGLLENAVITDGFAWPDRATIAHLRKLHQRMGDLTGDVTNWIEIIPLNHEFHRIIWRHSPLKLVVDEVERAWGLADAYIAESYRQPAHRTAAIAEHAEIIAALTARDLDRLRQAHLAHRDSTRHGADASIRGLA